MPHAVVVGFYRFVVDAVGDEAGQDLVRCAATCAIVKIRTGELGIWASTDHVARLLSIPIGGGMEEQCHDGSQKRHSDAAEQGRVDRISEC